MMQLRIRRQTKPQIPETLSPKPPKLECPEGDPALRQLYERIARGHALAEAEEQARRKLPGG